MDKRELEELVRQVLLEQLGGGGHGVRSVPVPALGVEIGRASYRERV